MRRVSVILVILMTLCNSPSLWSVVPDPIPCFKDLQVHFFQESLVTRALSLYNIPQGLWSKINDTLTAKSYTVPDRMKTVTANMVPNPIEYPMQRGPTSKILKKVLMDVFYETMTQYQVNERPTADFVFDYIFTEQMPKFIHCFGEVAKELAPDFD